MTAAWVVVARWCDDGWPVAAFAEQERAEKRVHALERLSAWARSAGRPLSRMEDGEWWYVASVPFYGAQRQCPAFYADLDAARGAG